MRDALVTNVDFDRVQINALADKVSAENGWLCGCGSCPSFDLESVWESDPDIRSLKSLLLFGLRGLGAFAHHAAALGSHDARVDGFFVKGLAALAENLSAGELMGLVHELGLVNLRCMDILEKAHVRAFLSPNVRAALTAKYGLRSITTAARDLGELYGKM